MKDKNKQGTSQLFNFVPGSYLERTSRPVYALVFLLPFILLYELGTLLIQTNTLNPDIITHAWRGRVVAFIWMQRSLEYLGFGNKLSWIATPLAVILILIALQLTSGKSWQVGIADFFPMAFECVLLAVPLIVFGLLLNRSMGYTAGGERTGGDSVKARVVEDEADERSPSGDNTIPVCASGTQGINGDYRHSRAAGAVRQNTPTSQGVLPDIVTGIGAGIYEELIFRLVLICLLMILFNDLFRLSHSNSILLSILVSSALFSAYHYVDFFKWRLYLTGTFNLAEFGFRTIAGVYFAVVFAIRGFGIPAGTHIFYDIFATLINVFVFGGTSSSA